MAGLKWFNSMRATRSLSLGDGCRRRAPTVLCRIRQGGPERPREPHQIEDGQAVKHRRDQNPHAIAVVEAEEGLDASCPPQTFPERGSCVDAGGGGRACGCAHEDLLRAESEATLGISTEHNIRGFRPMSAAKENREEYFPSHSATSGAPHQ